MSFNSLTPTNPAGSDGTVATPAGDLVGTRFNPKTSRFYDACDSTIWECETDCGVLVDRKYLGKNDSGCDVFVPYSHSTVEVIPAAPTPGTVFDPELKCSDIDGRTIVVKLDVATAAATLHELDGSPITDGSKAVTCAGIDRECVTIKRCNAAGEWQIKNFINTADPTDVVGPIFIDPNGAITTDPGDLTLCSNENFAQIKCFPKCDDVNGDETDIKSYYEAFAVEWDGTTLVSTPAGTFQDEGMTTAYAPVNPIDCCDIGDEAVEKSGREFIDGFGSWSPGLITSSYTVRAHLVADPANPPTFTDSFGVTTPIFQGESFSYQFDSCNVDVTPVVNSNAGDQIVITYITKN